MISAKEAAELAEKNKLVRDAEHVAREAEKLHAKLNIVRKAAVERIEKAIEAGRRRASFIPSDEKIMVLYSGSYVWGTVGSLPPAALDAILEEFSALGYAAKLDHGDGRHIHLVFTW